MRRVSYVLPLVLILMVLTFGLFLPRITTSFLDRRLSETTVEMENAAISLTLAQEMDLVELPSLDFFQTLALISGPCSFVALSEGVHLTDVEAGIVAMFPAHYIDADILAFGAAPDQVTPLLLTSETDPSQSGIFWYCTWQDHPENVIWVDDQTGVAVCFRLTIGKNKELPFADLAWAAATYCEDIYQELPEIRVTDIITALEQGAVTEAFVVLEMNHESFDGFFQVDPPDETYVLCIERLGNEVCFNCFEQTDAASSSVSIAE